MWKYPPRRILVAVDFGEASTRALRVAGDLARLFDATVTALHAESFEAPPYFTADQVKQIERQRRAARGEAVRYLKRYADRHSGVDVTPAISDVASGDAIVEAARDHDLIVMGTHGRRGPARWWAGSVAERVVRESPIPVLVVRAAANAVSFKRIVTVAGHGTFDGPARRYARGLASAFNVDPPKEAAPSIKAASLQDASLVVVPQRSREGAARLPFAATEHVVRDCRRPILFVPPV